MVTCLNLAATALVTSLFTVLFAFVELQSAPTGTSYPPIIVAGRMRIAYRRSRRGVGANLGEVSIIFWWIGIKAAVFAW